MTRIVTRSILAMQQSPVVDATELSSATGRCPATYTPLATLRVAVTWAQQSKRERGRNLGGSEMTAFSSFVVVIAVLLAAAGTFVATIYLSGLLMQRMQHLQRSNEPRAQYSDVWNWQRQR